MKVASLQVSERNRSIQDLSPLRHSRERGRPNRFAMWPEIWPQTHRKRQE